jgi:molecular chaperone DnaK
MPVPSRTVGIDLGTTYSALAILNDVGRPEIIPNNDGERLTPSVVLFDGSEIIVGSDAKAQIIARHESVVECIKREMGNPHYSHSHESKRWSPEEISALILKKLKQDSEQYLGSPVTDCVITVPAYFNDPRRRATIHAGTIAGLNVRRIINEPTAAAIAFGFLDPKHHNRTILVYDFGGGTLDVTILRIVKKHSGTKSTMRVKLDVRATDGHHWLGGRDIDELLMKYIAERFQAKHNIDPLKASPEIQQQFLMKAEHAKCDLANMESTNITVTAGGKTLSMTLDYQTFDDLIYPIVQQTQAVVEACLDAAELRPQDIDNILLVGGSTRLRSVRQFICDMFGKKPEVSINPDEAVALGAALFAGTYDQLTPYAPVIELEDVTAQGLGIEAHTNGPTSPRENFILIPKNTRIPVQGTHPFETLFKDQREVEIPILAGDDKRPLYCHRIGTVILPDLPPGRPAGQPLDTMLKYDCNGIVEVTARDVESGKMITAVLRYEQGMTKQQVESSIKNVEEFTII